MDVRMSIPQGQQQARERWNTEQSGAAFDLKKKPYLTEEAREFIAQRSFFAMSGLGRANELDGLLVMDSPGCVQTPDNHSCLLRLDYKLGHTPLVQRLLYSSYDDQHPQLGLFFISHATRERLCVQGSAVPLPPNALKSLPTSASFQHLWILMNVQQAFFHCAKYIRTRVSGLNAALTEEQTWHLPDLHYGSQPYLSRAVCAYIAQQVLCFLCTTDKHGQCAINHRGGATGFLIPVLPNAEAPGGRIFLPDYTGNGAFEAIGNILETGQAALVIPSYTAHMALRVTGSASILELDELPKAIAERCIGAERVVSLSVQNVTLQRGDWSETIAYERRFAVTNSTLDTSVTACPIQ